MTNDLELRYHRLHAAVVAAVAAVNEAIDCPQQVQSALAELQHAVREDIDVPTDVDTDTRDPARHLVSMYRYEGKVRFPIGLDDEAEDLRRQLAADRTVRTVGNESGDIVVTELRAMIIGSLLRELAARLATGTAFGPSHNGEALAAVATDLAWELLDQTFVGRQ